MTDMTLYLQILLIILAAMITAILIDYASKKTGRDTKEDIKTVVNLLEKVKKAAEDGKITDEEVAEIQAATVLAKESVQPYVVAISDSGILTEIYRKIKNWIYN